MTAQEFFKAHINNAIRSIKLENEAKTLEAATKLDGKALAQIHAHLQKYAHEWGKEHAEIEARRLLIISIAYMRPEEVSTFKMLLLEMVAQA